MKNWNKIIAFLVLTVIISCGRDVSETLSTNPEFAQHIGAHTSGIISKKDKIQIQLTESLVGFDIEVPLKSNPFSFEPSISGKTEWVDSRTLVFTPSEDLKGNTEYIANFDLASLKNVPKDIANFVFSFRTIQQNFDLTIIGSETPNENDFSSMQVNGKISFADIVDSTELKKGLSAYQNGSELAVTFSPVNSKEYRYVVKGVKRQKQNSEVIVKANADAFQAPINKEEKLTIYGLDQFVVANVKVIQFPEQYIDILFSDPIDGNQQLGGLITLGGNQISNYVIDGHHVKIYSNQPIEGNRSLTIYAGVKNVKGKSLTNDFIKNIAFETIQPDVRKISDGTIMPTSNGLRYPFEAVNLKAVDVIVTKVYENNLVQFLQVNELNGEYQLKRVGKKVFTKRFNIEQTGANLNQWNKYFIDLTDVIGQDKGALYQVVLRFKKSYANYACAETDNMEEVEDESFNEIEWTEKDWDSYGDYYYDYDYEYDYDYSERNNPCHSMYYRSKGLTQNFLLSDIGLIAKAGSDRVLNIYANDILSTNPLSGVEIDVYNWQQQVIGKVKTDGQGTASIKLEEKPFVIIAKNGPQRGYLKLNDGNALSLSKFDVAGAATKKGVKGLIYGERGVWRPGDSLFISFILEDKENIIPEGHPIEFKLYNPKYQLVTRRVTKKRAEEIYNFNSVTDPDAPTGNYRAEISIGSRVFTKYLKVETVKPNRLKILVDAGTEILSRFEQSNISLEAKWLHGATAGGLKAKVDASIDQAGTRFDGFNGYTFDDPTKRFYSNDFTVFNGNLNSEGKSSFPLNIKVDNASPGMLNAHLSTKVFEQGGGFSVNQTSFKYSPYRSYAGVKVPKGSMYAGTLETNKSHTFNLANVSETGKKLSNKLEVKIYKIEWRWWWDNYDRDLSSYISRSSTVPVFNKTVSASGGKATVSTEFKTYGRYLIVVKDLISNHTTGKIFWADEPYWSRSNRTDNEFATMLAFSTDKEKYEVGEEVKITFPSSGGGRALVSIESGSKVISTKWIKTEDGATKDFFKVTPEMAPNVFINITLLQPHENTKNDLPVRMYGVVPIQVENKDSHLEPIIAMDEVLRPETKATIKINEKDGKSMNYTLAIVDEGLLDLTNYKTPDPWNVFYAREALGVKTWDLYDEIMNAYTLEMDKLLATGGGGELNPDKQSSRANRFKPMVKFLGPFKLKGGTAKHIIDIPNYVGSVRVMVVAADDLRYGNAEKTVPVRNPLMVLGTLPRVLGPEEEIDLPVNVFANEDQVKNVTVKVEANDLFELATTTQNITFAQTGDQVVNFKLKTKKNIGVGKVKITVKSGNLTARDEIELDVRPSNPVVTDVIEKIVQPGETFNTDVALKGIQGTNNLRLEVSAIPPINLTERLNYLIRYPHGCIEQTTSSVFPQLYLADIMELSQNQKLEIENNIKAAIQRLTKFQTVSGGFAYWPGNVEPSEWGTNYGAHFVIEAEKKGYAIPFGLKKNLMKYMSSKAKEWKKASNTMSNYNMYKNNDLTQAYRLYVLALGGNEDRGAMNRLRETKNLQLTAKWRLAGAYQLLKQAKAANELIFNVGIQVADYKELSYSYGSGTRDEAMILEVLSMMGKKDQAAMLAKKISEQMNAQRWMSTQTTAYCLIGVSKFLENNNTSKLMNFDFKFNNQSTQSQKTTTAVFQAKASKLLSDGNNIMLKNKGDGILYVRVISDGIPVIGDQTKVASNLRMNIQYLTPSGQALNPANIKQGTDFKVQVSITNPGTRGNVEELALTQIFPAGWEILNSRMNSAYAGNSSAYDYQDIRDDRINTYFDLRSGQTKTFTYYLNSTYKGTYYMPTISCEAMYDKSISAREPGQWITVSE